MTPYTLKHLIMDLIVITVMLGLLLFLARDLEAAEYDIWFKMPGQKVWQQSCVINDDGISEVRYIPDGAVIAIRDVETCSLVVITRGR